MKYNIDWIKEKFDKEDIIKYIFFWGHEGNPSEQIGKFVFSQWFYSPITVDNIVFKTAEHWMMAQKAKLFGDLLAFDRIVKAEKPGEVKEIGRQIMGFDEKVWNAHKYEIVTQGNIHKFDQHKQLCDYLLHTNDRILVEVSPVDTIWGIGMAEDSNLINNPYNWRGLNLLGFALMDARDYLRQRENNESRV